MGGSINNLDLFPTRVGRFWRWPDGSSLPIVSGGDGDDDKDDPDADKGGQGGNDHLPTTQEEFDAVVARRLAQQARSKFGDYDDLKAKAEQFDAAAEAAKDEHQKALDKAAQDAAAEARKDERGKSDARIVRAEVKAVAGTKLADPEDAVRLIDLDQFEVDDNGDVDVKAIAAAIEELLKQKPYLAASAAGRKPDLGQGQRDTGKPGTSVESGRDLYAERHKKKTA